MSKQFLNFFSFKIRIDKSLDKRTLFLNSKQTFSIFLSFKMTASVFLSFSHSVFLSFSLSVFLSFCLLQEYTSHLMRSCHHRYLPCLNTRRWCSRFLSLCRLSLKYRRLIKKNMSFTLTSLEMTVIVKN